MRECFDEGVLQGFCDGELAPEMAETVASHLTGCLTCARAVGEVEAENLLLSRGLEAEFAMSVPTERLRQRVYEAISDLPAVDANRASRASVTSALPAVQGWLRSFAERFTLSPQRAFAYTGVAAVVLLVAILALVQYRNRQALPTNPMQVAGGNHTIVRETPASLSGKPESVVVASPSPDRLNPRTPFTPVVYSPRRGTSPRSPGANVAQVKLLPGERSYLKTIAALDTVIKAESSNPMRPALQSEYERNLAMVDRAIAATRSAAKSNPEDPDAAEFMFAAYQTKVDFLNQVADSRLSNRQH